MPLLEMKCISKSYPGVIAVDKVDFVLESGEVHGLVGGNGAGKSTLMKVLAGAEQPDEGEIFVDGKRAEIHDPDQARRLGIGIIYQELNLVSTLSVVENVYLGCELKTSTGMLDEKTMRKQAAVLFRDLDLEINLETRVGDLSVAKQQMVEIAKALHLRSRVLVMDEPTAPLLEHDIERLFEIVRRLRDRGVGIIYISHRLEELYQICDSVTVMRDGRIVGTRMPEQLNRDELIRMMINRDLEAAFPESQSEPGEELLKIDGLNRSPVLRNISFIVRKGEVVGIAGLMGAGRTELLRAIFGADPHESGSIAINGRTVKIRSPHDAVRNGLGLVPEDRKEQGVILKMAIRDNITLSSLSSTSRWGLTDERAENAESRSLVEKLGVKTSGILTQTVGLLSGGNQQKVVLAKWLATKSKVMLLDEPTRGIDVGAKSDFYALIRELAADGLGVVVVSSDILEVIGLSDRVYVMYRGSIAGELTGKDITQEKILALSMFGAA